MHLAWFAVTLTENTEESKVTDYFQKDIHWGCCFTSKLFTEKHLSTDYCCLTLYNVLLIWPLCVNPSGKRPLLRKVSHRLCVNPEIFLYTTKIKWFYSGCQQGVVVACVVSDRAKVTKGLPDVVAIMEGKVCHQESTADSTMQTETQSYTLILC